MKLISLLLLIVFTISGCSQSVKEPDNKPTQKVFREMASLEFGLNESELELNQCFSNKKVACYEQFPYMDTDANEVVENYNQCIQEQSVGCAQEAGRDDIVHTITKDSVAATVSFDWFFLSPYKLKKFWNFYNKLKELKNRISKNAKKALSRGKDISLSSMHGFGIGVSASAFAVVGHSFTGEAIIHDKELAVFCAPGIQFVTDIGVSAMVSGVKTLSCEKNNDYLGKFLSISAGVSAEAFALPVGAELAYSFGFDIGQFLRQLKREKKLGHLDLNSLLKELKTFSYYYPKEVQLNYDSYKYAMGMGLKFSAVLLGQSISTRIGESLINASKYDGDVIMKRKKSVKSMGKIISELVTSKYTRGVIAKHNLSNLKIFFDKLGAAMSGCDSISGSVGLSLSLSPVNVGVGLHDYQSLMRVNLDKLFSLRSLSALALMNPFMLDDELKGNIIQLYHLATNLPLTIANRCYGPSVKSTMEKLDLMKELRE